VVGEQKNLYTLAPIAHQQLALSSLLQIKGRGGKNYFNLAFYYLPWFAVVFILVRFTKQHLNCDSASDKMPCPKGKITHELCNLN